MPNSIDPTSPQNALLGAGQPGVMDALMMALNVNPGRGWGGQELLYGLQNLQHEQEINRQKQAAFMAQQGLINPYGGMPQQITPERGLLGKLGVSLGLVPESRALNPQEQQQYIFGQQQEQLRQGKMQQMQEMSLLRHLQGQHIAAQIDMMPIEERRKLQDSLGLSHLRDLQGAHLSALIQQMPEQMDLKRQHYQAIEDLRAGELELRQHDEQRKADAGQTLSDLRRARIEQMPEEMLLKRQQAEARSRLANAQADRIAKLIEQMPAEEQRKALQSEDLSQLRNLQGDALRQKILNSSNEQRQKLVRTLTETVSKLGTEAAGPLIQDITGRDLPAGMPTVPAPKTKGGMTEYQKAQQERQVAKDAEAKAKTETDPLIRRLNEIGKALQTGKMGGNPLTAAQRQALLQERSDTHERIAAIHQQLGTVVPETPLDVSSGEDVFAPPPKPTSGPSWFTQGAGLVAPGSYGTAHWLAGSPEATPTSIPSPRATRTPQQETPQRVKTAVPVAGVPGATIRQVK